MGVKFNTDLSDSFRKARGQSTESSLNTDLKGVPKRNNRSGSSQCTSYEKFLSKYSDLETNFLRFTTQDLVYFFREKSREAGAKYVIANMKRDMGIFKRLKESFSIAEILLMIEFIFSGDQTYLDISRTQPTVLSSNWVNTVYQDSIDWANDRYVDKKNKSSHTDKREWRKSNTNKSKIGEWGDE